jgi:radical SAM protein (TIGR01212 family)
VLREKYEEALKQEGIVALAIATRPDCLPEEVLDLLEELSKKVYIWVELGLQTVNDKSARLINRGYMLEVFDEALERLHKRNIDVVVHAILGLPEETREDMLRTVNYIANRPIKGVKFHLLHLMQETPMVKLYEMGRLRLLEEEEYIDLICTSITLLPQDIIIHRLTGDSPRKLLIGPMWSLKKWEILNAIDRKLAEDDLYQGLYFSTKS